MAKPLGAKAILIREAIGKNPDLGNIDLAEMLNGSEEAKKGKIEVKPADIAAQKQAMKKGKAGRKAKKTAAVWVVPAENGAPERGRPPVKANAVPVERANPVELIDRVFGLAEECGGLGQLKRLVERLSAAR